MSQTRREARADRESAISIRAFLTETGIAVLAVALGYAVPVFLAELNNLLGVAVSVITISAITVYYSLRRPMYFPLYWLLLLLMQSFWVGVSAAPFGHDPSVVITESKTVSLVVASICFARPIWNWLAARPGALIAVVMYVVYVVARTANLSAPTFAYARNFLGPVLMIALFAAIFEKLARAQRLNYARNLSLLIAGLLFIGTVIELVVGEYQWRSFLNAHNQVSLGSLSTYTNFFGIRMERVGGLMVEPVLTGYVAGVVLVFLMLLSVQHGRAPLKSFTPYISGAVLVLVVMFVAAAKASLLMIVLAVILWAIVLMIPRMQTGWIIVLAWCGTLGMVLLYMVLLKGIDPVLNLWNEPLGLFGGDSTAIHLAGLVFGLKYAVQHIFGAGLGLGGNFQRNFTEETERPPYDEWLASGSESGIGVLAYQTGLFGIAFFLLLVFAFARLLGRTSAVILGVWSSTSLMAEGILGPLVAGLFMVGAVLFAEEVTESRFERWARSKVQFLRDRRNIEEPPGVRRGRVAK